jgi:hypothetical protein
MMDPQVEDKRKAADERLKVNEWDQKLKQNGYVPLAILPGLWFLFSHQNSMHPVAIAAAARTCDGGDGGVEVNRDKESTSAVRRKG